MYISWRWTAFSAIWVMGSGMSISSLIAWLQFRSCGCRVDFACRAGGLVDHGDEGGDLAADLVGFDGEPLGGLGAEEVHLLGFDLQQTVEGLQDEAAVFHGDAVDEDDAS